MSLPISIDGKVITKPWSSEELPYLDRGVTYDLPLPEHRAAALRSYSDNGFLVVPGWRDPGLMEMLEVYELQWLRDNQHRYPQGYGHTGYMDSPELRNILCRSSVSKVLESIIGEPMAVHLTLTNWRSTQRNWHQDGYLNPDLVQDHYVAVWIAVDDIHPDAGPFEYIPGSHKIWDPIRQDLMLELLGEDGSDPDWPYRSEDVLTPFFDDAIEQMDLPVKQFIARKGDILVWHPRLIHRGSAPVDQTRERRAIIAHYSGINHRSDMPKAVRQSTLALDPLHCVADGYYFPIGDLTT